MSASPKASLRFSYELGDDDVFRGSTAEFISAEGVRAVRARLERSVARKEWLAFVLEQIRADRDAAVYAVSVRQPSGSSRVYALDERTVEKIKKGELTLDDMTL